MDLTNTVHKDFRAASLLRCSALMLATLKSLCTVMYVSLQVYSKSAAFVLAIINKLDPF